MTGLVACDDIILTDSKTQYLVFIAGYVGHKLENNEVSCEICKSERNRTLQYDLGTNEFLYLFEIDRRGLKWPADFQLEIVTQAFSVFRVMKDYEAKVFNLDNEML